MWSEPAETTEMSSIPTLSLFSLPGHLLEHPGMPTPPRLTSASVPFLWEEAPGKPRPCTRSEVASPPRGPRTLELPPRLLNEAKQTNLQSPTTVLEGPEIMREKGGEGSSSKRWGSFRKCKEVVGAGTDCSSGGLDGGGCGGGRLGRKRTVSLSVSPNAKSQFLVNVYESFKQVVPWRRRSR